MSAHRKRKLIDGPAVASQVRTFRRGKTIMVEFFLDHQEALEAAGLRE